MTCRLASASILTAWLVLFAIDVGDDCGLVKHIPEDVDQAVDTVLADFGRAIKISDASLVTVSAASSARFDIRYPTLPPHSGILIAPSDSLHRENRESRRLKKRAKIHELYQVFLI